jgi:1-acyl-sn-glycerol-3-phosphate acyltransferase
MSRLAFAPRAWRATRVVLHAAEGLATTLCVFPFIGVRQKRTLIRRWSARLLRQLGLEARVHGTIDAREGNVLIVANHVSWLDIFVLNAQQPARFVAKSDLARWPFAGRLIRGSGTIFIERGRRTDTRRVNQDAVEALSTGDVVAVFPEGTTSDGATLLRFHSSLLQPIVDSSGHVQPVALRYRDAAGERSMAPTYGDESFAASFWRVCGERMLFVDVTAPAPIAASGVHRRELARAAEAAIRTALDSRAVATPPGTRGDRAGSQR